jgi:chemotaxis protein MotB
MAAAKPAKFDGSNQPPKIIVKKIYIEGGGGHHGGAWKVAYADFVTAMMAFFLLMWLLGATTEKQRKGLADYFAPTLIDKKQGSTGSDKGLFGGESLLDRDNLPHRAAQTGTRSITMPTVGAGGIKEGSGDKGTLKSARMRAEDRAAFEQLKAKLAARIANDPAFKAIRSQVRFTPTDEGLQIDLVDRADYSMFAMGTTMLVPDAARLISEIGRSISGTPNQVTVRGHTDNVPYGDPKLMNNWMLSTGRAEATRRRLAGSGVVEPRFQRIEGVADRVPYVKDAPADPRNRRVSITLLYR